MRGAGRRASYRIPTPQLPVHGHGQTETDSMTKYDHPPRPVPRATRPTPRARHRSPIAPPSKGQSVAACDTTSAQGAHHTSLTDDTLRSQTRSSDQAPRRCTTGAQPQCTILHASLCTPHMCHEHSRIHIHPPDRDISAETHTCTCRHGASRAHSREGGPVLLVAAQAEPRAKA